MTGAGLSPRTSSRLSALASADADGVIGRDAVAVEPLPAGLTSSSVDEMFRHQPDLSSVLIHRGDDAGVTLLSRDRFDWWMTGRLGYGRALNLRRPIDDLLEPPPLVLDSETPFGPAMVAILGRPHRYRFEDVPVARLDGQWAVLAVPPALTTLAETFAHRSVHDPLTGLPNRIAISVAVREALDSAHTAVAMLYVDLDHFKSVNDTWGHDAGDEVLREVARRLTTATPESAVVARIGGDEFAVLLFAAAGSAAAEQIGERIVFALAAPFHLADGTANIGASVGVAALHPGADPMREAPHELLLTTDELLLRRADRAMYGAKTGGRGRVVPFQVAHSG